jgi:hypothetical protein
MEVHEHYWLANIIANSICKVLVICPSPMNRKLVMEKVLSFAHVSANTPNYMLSSKLTLAQQVLVGVNQSLGKINKKIPMPS